MPTRIKDLEIQEISSVRKGSSPGSRVLLLKSAERDEAMETTTIMKAFRDGNFHKAMGDAVELRKSGRIGPGAYDELYKFAAQTAYPLAKPWEAQELYRQTPGGSRMFNEGLVADYADLQRSTARTNASLVAKSTKKKPVVVHDDNQPPDDDAEPDEDPDDELRKLGEAYRLAHPAAKFSKEQAVAHVMAHDPDGQRLAFESKRKQMSKLYGEKAAAVFGKAERQMSAAARTPPQPRPDVRVDPANRAQLDAGDTAVEGGHQDGRDFDAKIKQLMNEQQISRDEAISILHRLEKRARGFTF
jgi:hypothetical protein